MRVRVRVRVRGSRTPNPNPNPYPNQVSAAQSTGGGGGLGVQAERVKLLVLGGVTYGGYRGATGALHTIELRCLPAEPALAGAAGPG